MTPREKAINHLALRIEKLIAHAAKQPIERHRLNSQQIANAAFEDFESYRSSVDLAHECPDPPNEEVLREVESAVFNGHSDPNCVDWDNWKFCSGLYFAVHRCERAGHTREAIKAAFYRAVALNTR